PHRSPNGSGSSTGSSRRRLEPRRDQMDDAQIYQAVLDAARARRPAALATIVATRGSVPRRPGSKMVIEPGVGLIGTIGGGCGEGEVIEAAEEVIATGE